MPNPVLKHIRDDRNNVTYDFEAVTDPTLSVQERAADAKAAGDAISNLRTAFQQVEKTISNKYQLPNMGHNPGFYIASDGRIGTDQSLLICYIPVMDGAVYDIYSDGVVRCGTAESFMGIARDEYVDDFIEIGASDSSRTIIINQNAKILCVYAVNNANFTLYETLAEKVLPKKHIKFIPITGLYVSQSGRIGVDAGLEIYYSLIDPNTRYKITFDDTYTSERVGFCSEFPAKDVVLDAFDRALSPSKALLSESNSRYMVVYTNDANPVFDCICDYGLVTQNEIQKKYDITMERGAFVTGGGQSNALVNIKDYCRSKYMVNIKGATQIVLEGTIGLTSIGTYFYNSDMEVMYYVTIPDKTHIAVPYGAAYIRLEAKTTENVEYIKATFIGAKDAITEEKNIIQTGVGVEYVTFPVKPGLFGTSILMLPPNYSANGDKVPLVLWMDGSGNYTTWNGSFSPDKIEYLRYLRDEGFAVISVFSWGSYLYTQYNNCGQAYPYPTPTNIACLIAGINNVCDKYNIDRNNIHIMSKSQGGQCALWFATHNLINAKSIGMFSPVLDYLSMPGESRYAGSRQAVAEDLGLSNTAYYISDSYNTYASDGVAFWEENMEKLCMLNEAWGKLVGGTLASRFASSIADGNAFWSNQLWNHPEVTDYYDDTDYAIIGDGVPVKIWGASDDNQTPYRKMVEVVAQLQNGGTEAHLRTFERGTGGHGCADVGSNIVQSVTTACGITYSNVPTGWVENVEWIRINMPKQA